MPCSHCGSTGGALGNPARVLYDELRNEQASWTDAVFWYVIGAMSMAAICWIR